MAIGIDPTVDYAFKRLLVSPEYSGITIHFLNAILQGIPPITAVKILNPILDQENADSKLSVLDIRALDDLGRTLNIEMQTALPAGFRERLVYYVSRLYAGAGHRGRKYTTLSPAISICVLGKSLFPEAPQLHLDFRLQNAETGLVLSHDLQIHLLDLPKYTGAIDSPVGKSPLEKWAYFFRFAAQSTPQELSRRLVDPEFKEAAGVLEMVAKTPRERMLYEARLKHELDTAGRVEQATLDGLIQGRAEGREETLEIAEVAARVLVLQTKLDLPVKPLSDLVKLGLAKLSKLEAELTRKLRKL